MRNADWDRRHHRQLDRRQPHDRHPRVLRLSVAGRDDQHVVARGAEVLDDPPHRVRDAVDHRQEALRDDRYAHATSLRPPLIRSAAPGDVPPNVRRTADSSRLVRLSARRRPCGRAILRCVRLNPHGEVPDVGIPRRLAASMTIGEQQEWLHRYLGRRRVTRRTALRGGERAGRARRHDRAVGVGGCAQAASTPVGVIGRHLSFGSDPRRQMAIAAELTGKPMGPVVVDVGADAGYGHTVEAEVRNLVSMVPQQDGSIRGAEQFFVHGVIGGLPPGTRLHYRFRLADGTTTPDAVFATAPARTAAGPVHVHRVRRPGRERGPDAVRADRLQRQTTSPTTPAAPRRPRTHWWRWSRRSAPRSTCSRATSATPIPHASDAGVRAALAPIFDRFAVDLVVQGHNHQYERTDPIRAASPPGRPPTAPASRLRGTAPPTSAAARRPAALRLAVRGDRQLPRRADPARPVTSYVAGSHGAKTARDRHVVAHPLPRLRLPVRARHARSTGWRRDDERARGERHRAGDRPGRPGPRPRAATPAAWRLRGSGLSVPGHLGG